MPARWCISANHRAASRAEAATTQLAGGKGSGKAGKNPTVADIVRAVDDAPTPFGIWIAEAPIRNGSSSSSAMRPRGDHLVT